MTDAAPRIPLPTQTSMDADQRRVHDAIVSGKRGSVIGPLLAALHQPSLAERWHRLGEFLRFDTTLPPQLSELAILVTARRWNSELEWVIHARAARAAGLAEAIIDALREGRPPPLEDDAQREVYAYVASLQNLGRVTDEMHAAIVRRWGVVGVVELTALTGYYSMVAMTLNAHRIPLPDGVEPELDPDGTRPAPRLSDLPLPNGSDI